MSGAIKDIPLVGAPIARVDGPRKVTGNARYALDHDRPVEALTGVLASSTIGKGRIARIYTAAAEQAVGVRLVVTHHNAPAQGRTDPAQPNAYMRARPLFVGTDIAWYGQPVALVVADTFEQARHAAALIEVTYERQGGSFAFSENLPLEEPEKVNVGFAAATDTGNFAGAFVAGAVTVDAEYHTPVIYSQPLEPHSTVAQWDGKRLSVISSHQTIANIHTSIAATFNLKPEQVKVEAPFVGGGFGSKLHVHADAIAASMAAMMTGRRVRVSLMRRQMFRDIGGRPEHNQRVRLAADLAGRLTAFGHDVTLFCRHDDTYREQTATAGRSLYAAPNRRTRHRTFHLDFHFGEPVRAPGEAPGLFAIESAMDELAVKLEIDPVELRLMNDAQTDPESGVPLTGRRLSDCLRAGAERFGWDMRSAEPGGRREGDWLIGMGVASAIRAHFQGNTKVRVAITPQRRVEVYSDLTDIGTGSYTVLTQLTAELLDVPLDAVDIKLASSDYPRGPGSGGSWGASNTSGALGAACSALRAKLAPGQGNIGIIDHALASFPDGLFVEGTLPGMNELPDWERHSRHTYGAHFVEVMVHRLTCEVRLRRVLGVFAAGRILNEQTSRSQLMGGMIWGLSMALREEAHIDPRFGNVVNADLAEYLVPVHADIPDIEVQLLPDEDLHANPLGIKGVGELGSCGSAAAATNAIYNACGVRIRAIPVTLGKIIAALGD